MDESIFIHESLVRRKMWTADRIRPIVTMTGSHQRTCVFGALCIDGRQLFRQYDFFNQYTFLHYLIQVQKKFGKLIVVLTDIGDIIAYKHGLHSCQEVYPYRNQ
jgi:hypothetical protein